MAHLVIVSFRLGGSDGVSIEAGKWRDALATLGHDVRLVAGEGPVDVVIEGLGAGATTPPSRDQLARAFDGADVVVVENLASLPLNVAARAALYEVLDGRAAIFHHHDLAWQRPHLAHLEGPRDQTGWRHVTINELSRVALRERGIEAATIYNSFDCDPPPGNRDATRRDLLVGDRTVMLMATRAIARKNVAGALDLASRLGAILWLLGPAEDGYGGELERLIAASGVDCRRGLGKIANMHDAYAAADVVVLASTWEGFGNPMLESVTHRRPLAIYPYPVALEIMEFGFRFFSLDDAEGIAGFIRAPNASVLERNLEIARSHFNLKALPARLAELLRNVGAE